jgi:protein TonB
MSENTYLQAPPKRKLLGLAAVVLLHGLLFWALQAGLTQSIVQKMPVVVQALLLEEKRPALPPPLPTPKPATPAPPKPAPAPPTPPPALVPPAITPSPVAAPQAIAAVSAPPPAVSTVAPAVVAAAPPALPAAPVKPPVRTTAGVNMAQCDKPDYPSASRRMEEEGTVGLRFLVGVDGKVVQSEVAKSSGYKRLDEAARAGLSKCRFKPATVDGQPEQAWTTIQYVWRLE